MEHKHIGADARPDYRYHSYRRARNVINVGHLVTPSTDPGDFTVEANGQLTLKAGDHIHIQAGTHFKAGSIVHVVPEYDVCSDFKHSQASQDGGNENEGSKITNDFLSSEHEKNEFQLYPNPSSNSFEINSNSDKWQSLEVFDLKGYLWFKAQVFEGNKIHVNELPSGMYLVKIKGENKVETHKFLKL